MSGTVLKLCRPSKCIFNCTIIRSLSDSKNYTPPPPEHPVKRTLRILGNDVKTSLGFKKETPLFPHHCDVVIIGGGVIGSSIAYWLKQRTRDGLEVVVVERDPSYAQASTVLSCGGLCQQFTVPENVQMSLYGAEFLRNIKTHLSVPNHEAPDVRFTPCGYMFLASESSAEHLQEAYKLQKQLGVKTELLSPQQLKERCPWMNVDDVALASHGLENEGWIDPWSLLGAFKRKARSLGTTYVKAEAVAFEFRNMQDALVEGMPTGSYESLDRLLVKTDEGDIQPIKFGIAIIAAGASSGSVARLARIGTGRGALSVPLPVVLKKRYVYCFHCPEGPGLRAPCLMDSSGIYLRREGLAGNYIAGISPLPEEEPSVDNLEVDYSFFDNTVWPLLCHRVSQFEHLMVKSAWAGYCDFNEFDENAIIGPHPAYHNLYLATGFGGHSVQQSAAAGRAIMEMIIDGGFQTIDLTRFGFERLIKQEPLLEKNII
ncbi:FAD-dependent oxidoreductase domain-containing protein 1-like [Bacillus rossius redtenbacheri]|uniref:FAD-dependent oxidoreductase domain-containing protein 1-like n=1 Tax=Bacillus rossius redtenbacheri TaxID=93214 RepID=UPI002FDD6788